MLSKLGLIPMKRFKALIAWYKEQQVGVAISVHPHALPITTQPRELCLFIPR